MVYSRLRPLRRINGKNNPEYQKWYWVNISKPNGYLERNRVNSLKHHRLQRQRIIDALGGKCVRCGFSDVRALQIDHVNGNGAKERRQFKHYTSCRIMIYQKILNGSKEYQLLCANCNWIKRFEEGEDN